MSELTREQFPLSASDFDRAVRDAMRCSGDHRWHTYILAHDAALRARLAELELTNVSLRQQRDELSKCKNEDNIIMAMSGNQVAWLAQQLATVTAERDEARKSKNDCVIDLYRKLDTKDEQLASLTLTWTTEQPTSPGLYGFKPDGRAPRVVRVTEKTIQSLYGIGAQWCGPILLPSLEGSAH